MNDEIKKRYADMALSATTLHDDACETLRKDALEMWVIYDHPRDMPDFFVARLWRIGPGGTMEATKGLHFAVTLDEVRALLPPGLFNLGRMSGDDPVITEVWV
jgi:hypothetical protein